MKNSWKWIPVLALAAMSVQAQDLPADGPGGCPPPPPPCAQRWMPPCREGQRPPCMKGRHERCGKPPCGMREEGPGCGGRPEMTEERRAKFDAMRQLRHAVRSETDEAKKAELVEQLRAKLGEMADEQSAMQKERLAAAEKRIAEQKARLDAQVEELRAMIAGAEAHRDEWIDEQVRLVVSGERPPMHRWHPGGERPDGRCPGQEGCPFMKCHTKHGEWGPKGAKECGKGPKCGKGFKGGKPCGRDGAGAPPPPPPEEGEGPDAMGGPEGPEGGEELPPPEMEE